MPTLDPPFKPTISPLSSARNQSLIPKESIKFNAVSKSAKGNDVGVVPVANNDLVIHGHTDKKFAVLRTEAACAFDFGDCVDNFVLVHKLL